MKRWLQVIQLLLFSVSELLNSGILIHVEGDYASRIDAA